MLISKKIKSNPLFVHIYEHFLVEKILDFHPNSQIFAQVFFSEEYSEIIIICKKEEFEALNLGESFDENILNLSNFSISEFEDFFKRAEAIKFKNLKENNIEEIPEIEIKKSFKVIKKTAKLQIFSVFISDNSTNYEKILFFVLRDYFSFFIRRFFETNLNPARLSDFYFNENNFCYTFQIKTFSNFTNTAAQNELINYSKNNYFYTLAKEILGNYSEDLINFEIYNNFESPIFIDDIRKNFSENILREIVNKISLKEI